MKDLIKVVVYSYVYGMNLYGTSYVGIDCGKGNLKSYFVDKLGWSDYKLKKTVKVLKREGIFEQQKDMNNGVKVMGKTFSKIILHSLV